MDSLTPKNKPGFLNLQAKLAIGFAILAIVSSGIITGIAIFNGRAQVFQDLRNHLRDAVSLGALSVDGDAHATLRDTSQQGNDTYLTLKRKFQQIRDSGMNFRYVYSLRITSGKAYFVVDAEEDPELVSNLMNIYADLPQYMIDRIPTLTEPYVHDEFYVDKRGTWLTGYAPIFTSDNQLDAVLAINISADYVVNYQNRLLWNSLLFYMAMLPVVALIGWFLGRQLARPILTLIDGAKRIETGDFDVRVNVDAKDELALLAESFNSLAAQLSELAGGLERTVAERTRKLEQRSVFLSAASEVSRDISTILEPNILIPQVVDLIQKSFNLYYVGLFLVDENNEWAVLNAGSGEAGSAMIAQGYRIRVGEGMIGWCIEHAQTRVAMKAEHDSVRLLTPLLPATKSEAALPLRSRGRVLGALSVQSDQPDVFDEATVSVLQSMADQVSIALDNARLYAESEQVVKTLRRLVVEYRQQAWKEAMKTRSVLGYHGDSRGIHPIEDTDVVSQKKQPGEMAIHSIQIPIKIRGEVLGFIEARKPEASGEWSQDEISLMNVLVDQLGVALENAQHFEESQRRAEREKMLAQITGRVRASSDINQILQTAVQELSEALRVPRGAIRLVRPEIHQPGKLPTDRTGAKGTGDGGSSDEQS